MTILLLLTVFALGVLAGACSWLVAAVWLEAGREMTNRSRLCHQPPIDHTNYPE